MNFSEFVGDACKKEYSFGGGGFAGVNMGDNTDVSYALYRLLIHERDS
jgi:hypothetical protein